MIKLTTRNSTYLVDEDAKTVALVKTDRPYALDTDHGGARPYLDWGTRKEDGRAWFCFPGGRTLLTSTVVERETVEATE